MFSICFSDSVAFVFLKQEDITLSEILPSQKDSTLASKVLNFIQSIKLKDAPEPAVIIQECLSLYIKKQVVSLALFLGLSFVCIHAKSSVYGHTLVKQQLSSQFSNIPLFLPGRWSCIRNRY